MTDMASDEASAGNLARTNAGCLWIVNLVRFALHALHYTHCTTHSEKCQ
jgi:hypothetical protein